MPVTKKSGGVPHRRPAADAAAPPDHEESDLIRFTAPPTPWVARRIGADRVFRGRLRPGTVSLPALIRHDGSAGITVALASRSIVLRSVGVAHQIPANVPCVVLSDTEWRITVTESTDLRIVHTHGVPSTLITSTLSKHRPNRFRNRELEVVRAGIKAATPIWIDASARPVGDLAEVPDASWRLIAGPDPTGTHDRDPFNAFVTMLTWAFEQAHGGGDPRLAAVAQYIEAHLSDPTLSTSSVAERLQISRRSLQTMFEDQGGVAVHIRHLRLNAALRMITQVPDEFPDLDAVAELTGLGSRRTLERAMRQLYGLSPRQARAHLLAGLLLRERHLNDLEAS